MRGNRGGGEGMGRKGGIEEGEGRKGWRKEKGWREVSTNIMIGKICYRLATDADSRGNSDQSGGEVLQDMS